MPNMDGIQAARTIRKTPECRNVPLVAISGYVFGERKKEAGEAGFSDYLTKPIDMGKLIGILMHYLPYKDPRASSSDPSPEAADSLPESVEQRVEEELKALLEIPIYYPDRIADKVEEIRSICGSHQTRYLKILQEIEKLAFAGDEEAFERYVSRQFPAD
ncbi:MAG: response regulator [Proteobacteria bacterium]|nr:response regulator [Pseudomonadota bacterium]